MAVFYRYYLFPLFCYTRYRFHRILLFSIVFILILSNNDIPVHNISPSSYYTQYIICINSSDLLNIVFIIFANSQCLFIKSVFPRTL